eukprot:GHVQ01007821.1.p1 GENE.GHVQ01007821.1~~GHVQ01007821.1.p1  ORF type:complete len:906 (+),score=113.58 GHVQ01007821.1:64-2781(+)
MEEVVKALQTLYGSKDRELTHAADKHLREWQKSNEAWVVADQLLVTGQPDEVRCFAAQTLRNKIMYDFVELPKEFHESLCASLIQYINNTPRGRTQTMLSLALSDLALQTANSWMCPVQTLVVELREKSMETLLLLLQHLPEESKNRRVMVDHGTRRTHINNLELSKVEVLTLLSEYRQNVQDPSLQMKALECWKSWISHTSLTESDSLGFYEDCFQRLFEDSDLPSECIVEVLRQSAPSSPAVDTALTACSSEQIRSSLSKAMEEEDVECLSRVSLVLTWTGVAVAENAVELLARDARVVQLFQMILSLTMWSSFERIWSGYGTGGDGRGGGGDSEGISCSEFWMKLCASFQKKVEKENEPGVAIVVELLERFLNVCMDQCVANPKRLDPHGAIDPQFREYRRMFLDGVIDCCLAIGPARVTNRVLERFAQIPRDDDMFAMHQEAYLELLLNCSYEVKSDPESVPMMTVLLEKISDIVPVDHPPNLLNIASRINAVNLVGQTVLWSGSRPDLLPSLLESLVSQGFLSLSKFEEADRMTAEYRDVYDWWLHKLRISAMVSYKDLCTRRGTLLHGMVDTLCQVVREHGMACPTEVRMYLLQGVSVIASSLPDNAAFLRVLENLCKPIIEDLKIDDEIARTGTALDSFSVILKDVINGVRQCPARGDVMGTFVCSTLWPLLTRLLTHYSTSERMVEKCIRCLKHSLRCVGHRFKPLVPSLVDLITEGAAAHLHTSYVYCAEYLAAEFEEDPEILSWLEKLFNDLSLRALDKLEAHATELLEYSELIEDFFGMVLRYLLYCPLVPAKSPHLERTLRVARLCLFQQQKAAVGVVFKFLDFAIRADKRDPPPPKMVSDEIKPVVEKVLPDIIEQLFLLLLSVPSHFVLDQLEVSLDSHPIRTETLRYICL